jgi:hypothetical protein
MSTADLGREAVYAAELAAFDGTSYERIIDLDELTAMSAAITGSPWWPIGAVEVSATRSDARSSRTYQRGGGTPRIRLAPTQMTPATLTHELAHALAGVENGHGPAFRRAHVDLVAWAFGAEPANWLADAYAAMGVSVGDRTWPSPTAHTAA